VTVPSLQKSYNREIYVTGPHRLTLQWYFTFIIFRKEQKRCSVNVIPEKITRHLQKQPHYK
jgi:hypothetical protein